jgi:hypothetical protein
LQTTVRQSESIGKRNTDPKKIPRDQRTNSSTKNENEEDNNIDSMKRPSCPPVKSPPALLEGAKHEWSINITGTSDRANSNFFNPNDINQSELTSATSSDLSIGIAHHKQGSTCYGDVQAFAVGTNSANNAPSFHELLNPQMPVNLNLSSSSVGRWFPERVQFPQQLIPQLPQPYATVTNSTNSLDNSITSYLPMIQDMQISGRPASDSNTKPNNALLLAPPIENRYQHSHPVQYLPILSSIQMGALNSFSSYGTSVAAANVGMPPTFASITPASNLLDIQSTTMDRSMLAMRPLPIDKDAFPQEDGDGNEGFALSYSPIIEPTGRGVEPNKGEQEKDNDGDDNLSLCFSDLAE